MRAHAGLIALGVAMAAGVHAQPADLHAKSGQTYTITLDRRMAESGSDGSSGSSTDVDTIIERVIAVRAEGVEAEFDLPKSATAQERASVWQVPARALLPFAGPPRLLNEAELAARVDPWLRKSNLTRAQCGKGIFTWNYFTIECDPRSALRMIERFHPATSEVREGAAYSAPSASGSVPLQSKPSSDGTLVLTAMLPVDVGVVRRERAQTAVTVAGFNGKALALETALTEQAAERIEGTIETTFEFDRQGDLRRRTILTRIVSTKSDGVSETRTVTEVLTRRCTAGCP